MRKIKIAQIGTSENSHGKFVFKSLKKQNDLFEVVGYAMPEDESEIMVKQENFFEGYPQLTVEAILTDPEIEAVAIETEEIYLTKYAQMAAEHGKHIHFEKPGGISLVDFEKLISTVRKRQLIFHTGYMYRYNPCIIELLEQIKAGELGEILSVEAQMNCAHTKQTRQWLENFPGGIMFFLGCHLIDLILQIKGTPERIIPLNKCTRSDGVTAEDFGMAIFEYQNGVSFAKVNACEIGGCARRQLVVAGTKKTVELKPLESTGNHAPLLHTQKTEYCSLDWSNAGETSNTEPFDRYDSMMADFAAMVRGEKENPYSYDYELELYRTVINACGRKDFV